MSKEGRDKANSELKKLRMMSPMSAEATVARKRKTLSSFYAFAWRFGAVRHNHPQEARAAADMRALTREERRLLRRGVARLAADGRPAEAAAVALLDGTGGSASALSGGPSGLRKTSIIANS
ncbi:hypothetical protein, partial [Salinifilum aidingensis]